MHKEEFVNVALPKTNAKPSADGINYSELLIKEEEFVLVRRHNNGRYSAYKSKLSSPSNYEVIDPVDQEDIDNWLQNWTLLFSSGSLKSPIDITHSIKLINMLQSMGKLPT
jgi:hypothetical protein